MNIENYRNILLSIVIFILLATGFAIAFLFNGISVLYFLIFWTIVTYATIDFIVGEDENEENTL